MSGTTSPSAKITMADVKRVLEKAETPVDAHDAKVEAVTKKGVPVEKKKAAPVEKNKNASVEKKVDPKYLDTTKVCY